jgi:hypothetical protein
MRSRQKKRISLRGRVSTGGRVSTRGAVCTPRVPSHVFDAGACGRNVTLARVDAIGLQAWIDQAAATRSPPPVLARYSARSPPW